MQTGGADAEAHDARPAIGLAGHRVYSMERIGIEPVTPRGTSQGALWNVGLLGAGLRACG